MIIAGYKRKYPDIKQLKPVFITILKNTKNYK